VHQATPLLERRVVESGERDRAHLDRHGGDANGAAGRGFFDGFDRRRGRYSFAVTDTETRSGRLPLVDYLVLEPEPHLVANQCTACGARFFDRRNACAACFNTSFDKVDVPTSGIVRAFTIVTFAAPGVPVPFASAVIDCDGTSVRGNIVGVDPTPENITLGMKVRLTTFPIGTDDNGTEAIGFGFEPQND
jgi:uncharacterized OB-fold protein